MKRIVIQVGQVGLLIKNRRVKRLLFEGTYWVFDVFEISIHETNTSLQTPIDIDLLLQSSLLADALEIVHIPQKSIGLVYKNADLHQVLIEGKHAFWKGLHPFTFETVDTTALNIPEGMLRKHLESYLMRPFLRMFTVPNAHKAVFFADGEILSTVGSGSYFFWNNGTEIELQSVDMRQQHLEISGQELLTKDKACVRVNFFVQFRVVAIDKALVENKDYKNQLYILLQLALRAYVGGFDLDALLSNKDRIASLILSATQEKIANLGVTAVDAGIRDIILPGDMRDIMNQVLVAEKKAQANGIMRREETAATRSLLNTAKLMENNQMLWKLKEMEYVEKIAERVGAISISGKGNVISELKELFIK